MDRSVDKAEQKNSWLDLPVAPCDRHPGSDALVVYVHVPKAGGRSMMRMLRDVYGDRLLVAHPKGWPQVLPDDVLRDIGERPQFYRAFSGHHAFGVHEVFRRPARYITTVREPLLRLESYYNFVKHWEIHHHHEAAAERNIQQFFEYLMDRNDIEVSNLQCLLMCGEKSFEQARSNLEKNFEFVIPLPRLAQAPPLLAKAFEWPFVPELHHENETRHKETMAELSGSMIAALSAMNSDDRQLYESAERRWSKTCR
jgi:hypothetical protein